MPSVAESQQYGSSLAAALRQGLRAIDGQQQVSFQPYVRTVLPIDGFVFWINAGLLSAQQLAAAGLTSAAPVAVNGSLHFATVGEQREDESIAIHKMVFTSEQPIAALAEIAPVVLYIATWTSPSGESFRFSFSRRDSFYQQANLSHYVGDAVYPVFQAQLIDTVADFDQRQVVSNSLPIWLAMMNAPYTSLVTTNVALYPSNLVPDNLPAPYAVVHIPAETTRLLQPIPYLDPTGNHWQLCAERVTFILYGLRNDDAMDFKDYILSYGELSDNFGVMTPPAMRDDHRTQTELAALAQRKTIEMEISYYQARARQVARQTIKSVVPSYTLASPV